MMLPLIISYSKANLGNLGIDAQKVLKELSGNHLCEFHYHEPQKGYTKVRMVVQDSDWSIVVEIGKDDLCFSNPWFRKNRVMDAIRETDGLVQECDVIFVDRRISPITYLLDWGKSAFLAEVRDLILKCRNLKKVVTRLDKDEEREIWTAYCDGLNALNKERRNFITLDYVGTPILYNDTKAGEIYTLKLGIGTDSIESVPSKVEKMLDDKYNIGEILINEEKTELEITCKGTEKILDEDLDGVTDYLQNYGFVMPENGVVNILKASVSYNNLRQRVDILEKIDTCLQKEGLKFSNEESLKYRFENDKDAESFLNIANNILGDLGYAFQSNTIRMGLEIDEEKRIAIRADLSQNSKIKVLAHKMSFTPENEDDYEKLKMDTLSVFKNYGVKVIFPNYYAVCKINADAAETQKRRELMRIAEKKLTEFRRISYKYTYDEAEARVMRFDFRFRSAEERENLIDQLTSTINVLGPSYKLTIKDRVGCTKIRFVRDAAVESQLEDELKANYQGEDIKLVDGKRYHKLFGNLLDSESILSPTLRDKYNRFMNECPIIGTCYNRTKDSIIVRLSEIFF